MASSWDLTPYICYLLKALGVGPRELCLEESQKTNLSHIWICDVRARAHITPTPTPARLPALFVFSAHELQEVEESITPA